MRWLTGAIDRAADSFGGLPFIVGYNLVTVAWILLAKSATWFPDQFPQLTFYTMIVSWLAINMSSFILYVDHRRQAKERVDEAHKLHTLEAIQTLVEAQSDVIPLVRQMVVNQLVILQEMQEREEVKM